MIIKEITLLSLEQYEEYKNIIPTIPAGRWWLRDSAVPGKVSCVYKKTVCNMSITEKGCVRPALIVIGLNASCGDKVQALGHSWTVLDKDLLLCDYHIGIQPFDKTYNHWPISALKYWLQDWCREKCIENEINVAITNQTEFLLFKAFCEKNNKKIVPHDFYKDFLINFAKDDVFYLQYVLHHEIVYGKRYIFVDHNKMTFAEFCEFITKENK